MLYAKRASRLSIYSRRAQPSITSIPTLGTGKGSTDSKRWTTIRPTERLRTLRRRSGAIRSLSVSFTVKRDLPSKISSRSLRMSHSSDFRSSHIASKGYSRASSEYESLRRVAIESVRSQLTGVSAYLALSRRMTQGSYRVGWQCIPDGQPASGGVQRRSVSRFSHVDVADPHSG
jgi:hypothetical protein